MDTSEHPINTNSSKKGQQAPSPHRPGHAALWFIIVLVIVALVGGYFYFNGQKSAPKDSEAQNLVQVYDVEGNPLLGGASVPTETFGWEGGGRKVSFVYPTEIIVGGKMLKLNPTLQSLDLTKYGIAEAAEELIADITQVDFVRQKKPFYRAFFITGSNQNDILSVLPLVLAQSDVDSDYRIESRESIGIGAIANVFKLSVRGPLQQDEGAETEGTGTGFLFPIGSGAMGEMYGVLYIRNTGDAEAHSAFIELFTTSLKVEQAI